VMLFKLSYKNIKSGIKDYVVYFMTLALGVSMFYLFNSLDSQSAIMKMNASSFNLIETLMSVINILSYFISVIFGCLIIYASRFLIRRRKNEFGIYLTLGMSKKTGFIYLSRRESINWIVFTCCWIVSRNIRFIFC